MPSFGSKAGVASSLSKLSLDGDKNKSEGTAATKTTKMKTKKPVVDSWEDEDLDDDDEEEEEEEEEEGDKPEADGAKAPPPTPISPTYRTASASALPYGNTDPTGTPLLLAGTSEGPRRPEKTDAVARRMIASALGVKAPKQTEEQKAYDKAIREQERKRREEEKAAEKMRLEEVEKAKAAIWDD